MTAADLDRIEKEGWELYHVERDPAETLNLAVEEPARLRQIITLWWHEAGKYGVLRILGGSPQPANADEMMVKPRRHIYFPDTAPIFIETSANINNADFVMIADLSVDDEESDGMLLALGDQFGGYGFLVVKGGPCFVYNYFGVSQQENLAPTLLMPGRHQVEFEFVKTGEPDFGRGLGAPGHAVLRVDGAVAVEAEMTMTAPVMLSFSGMQICGYHLAGPFLDYAPPFPFTGKLHTVKVEINSPSPMNAEAARCLHGPAVTRKPFWGKSN